MLVNFSWLVPNQIAGAGQIGEYKDCAFESAGTGSFRPSENANPTIGSKGELEKVNETKVEVIFPVHLKLVLVHL